MEKILIIFRGENYRSRNVIYPAPPLSPFGQTTHTITVSALVAIDNWKKTLINNLKDNNIQCDIAFVTYSSPILKQLINEMHPKYLIVDGDPLDPLLQYTKPLENFKATIRFAGKHIHEYDRIIILRFDLQYKFRLTEWPKWNEKGITLVGKDPHWPRNPINSDNLHHLYFDYIFIFDTDYYKHIKESTDNMKRFPHEIGRYLYEHNLPLNIMFDDYYTMTNHPLFSYVTWEETPDLDNPTPGIKMPPMLSNPTLNDLKEWKQMYGEEIENIAKKLKIF